MFWTPKGCLLTHRGRHLTRASQSNKMINVLSWLCSRSLEVSIHLLNIIFSEYVNNSINILLATSSCTKYQRKNALSIGRGRGGVYHFAIFFDIFQSRLSSAALSLSNYRGLREVKSWVLLFSSFTAYSHQLVSTGGHRRWKKLTWGTKLFFDMIDMRAEGHPRRSERSLGNGSRRQWSQSVLL